MNLLAILYFFQWVLSMFSSFILFSQNCSVLCFQSNNRQIKILLITNVLCLKFDKNKISSQIKTMAFALGFQSLYTNRRMPPCWSSLVH